MKTSILTAILCTCWFAFLNAKVVGQATQAGASPPLADGKVQSWIRLIATRESPESYFNATREAVEAKIQDNLTDKTWLTQALAYFSEADPKGVQPDAIPGLMDFSRWHLGIFPDASLKVLAPSIDASNQNVARTAEEMISGAMVWVVSSPLDDTGVGEFSAVHSYLVSRGQSDPSWRLVRDMYRANPDAALRTATNVYFDSDREARLSAERDRKELTMLVLAFDIASDEQKPDMSKKVLAKLNELAAHPHWSLRGYALATINRNLLFTVARGPHWVKQIDIPARLTEDKNPFVSAYAKEVVQLSKIYGRGDPSRGQ